MPAFGTFLIHSRKSPQIFFENLEFLFNAGRGDNICTSIRFDLITTTAIPTYHDAGFVFTGKHKGLAFRTEHNH